MTSAKQIWTPRTWSQSYSDYGTYDRPGSDLAMFYGQYDNTYTHKWTDHYDGTEVNFGRTLSGSDNKMRNLSEVWKHTSGYGLTHGYCKLDNYISWHIGSIPNRDTTTVIKSREQHMLPGYVGLRFQYRWPNNNDRNYWSNSPVHINDMMMHYYNYAANRMQSYNCSLHSVSTSTQNHWPDRYVSDNSRRSDTWKGCTWRVAEVGARNQVRNDQLFLVGASFEMKYSNRGTASHSRCMDIRNMTPIWDAASGHSYRPVLAYPHVYPWTSQWPAQLYTS